MRAISSQFGWLPQASGIGRLPRLAKDGSVGAGRDDEKGRNGLDVVLGQKACNDLHAVRRGGGSGAVAPAAELRADIAGAQAEQTGYRRLHAAEARAMATGAGPERRAADRH